jgi:hypothetical protein
MDTTMTATNDEVRQQFEAVATDGGWRVDRMTITGAGHE